MDINVEIDMDTHIDMDRDIDVNTSTYRHGYRWSTLDIQCYMLHIDITRYLRNKDS